MGLSRQLVTSKVTLAHTFQSDESATDSSNTVTVSIKRLDGTVVESGNAATTQTGVYTYSPAPIGQLDEVTVDWTGTFTGVPVTVRDELQIVGGFLFSIAQARAKHTGLSNTSVYPTSLLVDMRNEIEDEFARICFQSFVPRFARETLSGNGLQYLGTGHRLITAIRKIIVGGVAYTSDQLAAVGKTNDGRLVQPQGGIWPRGAGNIVVEFEHGRGYVPPLVSQAGIIRLRSLIATTTTGIPDRATSFTTQDGGTYRLSKSERLLTGVPEVDGILAKYAQPPRTVIA